MKSQQNRLELVTRRATYQLNSFGDLLEKIVPEALQHAISESVEFRQGLPLNYLSHLGVAHSDANTPMRRDFMELIRQVCSLGNAIVSLFFC